MTPQPVFLWGALGTFTSLFAFICGHRKGSLYPRREPPIVTDHNANIEHCFDPWTRPDHGTSPSAHPTKKRRLSPPLKLFTTISEPNHRSARPLIAQFRLTEVNLNEVSSRPLKGRHGGTCACLKRISLLALPPKNQSSKPVTREWWLAIVDAKGAFAYLT